MSCISIGKAIKSLLVAGLSKTSIKNKIYPLIADETTTFPFIVYRRSSIIPESDKDYSNDSAHIQIMIAANNYAESVELAEQVRTSLVHKKGIIQTIPIEDISLVDGSEEFIDNTFVQNLIFKITINSSLIIQ